MLGGLQFRFYLEGQTEVIKMKLSGITMWFLAYNSEADQERSDPAFSKFYFYLRVDMNVGFQCI